jgi:hypothetical protein
MASRLHDHLDAAVLLGMMAAAPSQCFHRLKILDVNENERRAGTSCSAALRGGGTGDSVMDFKIAPTFAGALLKSASRQFAIVTGASTGIGLELAKCCAKMASIS